MVREHMEFDFDRVIDRRDTGSEKWERWAGRDVLPLWVADMDFAAPPPVLAALRARVEHGVFGYTVPTTGAIEAIVAHCARRYGWQVQPEWIEFLPGVNRITALAVRALTEHGDSVLVPTPVYPPLHLAPATAGRQLVPVPLVRDAAGRYSLDFEALAATAVKTRARLLIFCHPHNPVGRVWTRREVERLAELARQHGLAVVSDEIFADLAFEGRQHDPFLAVAPDLAPRAVVGLSPSKTFNLAGLGCAYAIIPDPSVRRRLRAERRGLVPPDLAAFAYPALEAALNAGERWRLALLDYLAANRDYLAAALARVAPEIRMTPIEATYLAWLDVTALGLAEPTAFFLSAGLGFSDGRDFRGPGHVRLNFGCPRVVLAAAIERLERALEAWRRDPDAASAAPPPAH
jgi:cystathionine beta-lyase